MTKPISPSEIVDAKKQSIPVEVIEAFNELIAKNWDGHSSYMLQTDVVDLILIKLKCSNKNKRELIFKNRWLDIEKIFEKFGWNVLYDKPGYCETYEASFTFKKKHVKRGR